MPTQKEDIVLHQIKAVLKERHKLLLDLFKNEINIGLRYELKIKIDEIVAIYNQLFGNDKI